MKELSDYIIMRKESVKAQLVVPTQWNSGLITVMRFTKNNVEAAVNKSIKCGFYRIGTLTSQMDTNGQISYYFRVCYFGRTDFNSNSLQERISSHLYLNDNTDEKNVYDDKHYFGVWECDSTMYAYDLELADYNAFFYGPNERRTGNGYFSEEIYSHNTRNIAPRHQQSDKVFIDNKIKPAHP